MPSKTVPLPPTEGSASELTFYKTKDKVNDNTSGDVQRKEDSSASRFVRMLCCSMTSCTGSFILCLVCMIGVVVWACTFAAGYLSTDSAIQSLRSEIKQNAVQKLSGNLMEPMSILLDQAADLAEREPDLRGFDEVFSTARRMMKTLSFHNDITFSIFIQLPNGDHIHSKYSDANETEFTLEYGHASLGQGTLYTYLVNQTDDTYTSMTTTEYEDNISNTDWFQRAIFLNKPTVTPSPITLHEPTNTGALLGFTYTTPVHFKNGSLLGVVAADVGLNNIGDVLSDIRIGKSGSCMLCMRTGVIIGTSSEKLLADGTGEVTHATDAILPIHAKIARKLEDSVTIDRVPDGYSMTVGGTYVADIAVIDPLLYDQTPMFPRDWIIITALPIFQDYTQIVLWTNLGSAFVISILVVLLSIGAIGMYIFIFVRPLHNLIKDLESVQTMELDKIKVRRLEIMFETRELQKRFYKSLHFLKLWRQFISPQLLKAQLQKYNGVDEEEYEKSQRDDISSTFSASVHSSTKKTKISSHHSSTQRKMRERAALSTFEIGIKEMKLAVMAVRVIDSEYVVEMDSDSFCRQHSALLGAFTDVVKVHKGIVDRFSDKNFISSFFSLKQAVAASVEAKKKLSSIHKKLGTDERHTVSFCIGIGWDMTCLGVLGSDSMRSNRIFGNAVENALAASRIGVEWPAKVVIDRATFKAMDKKIFVTRPICEATFNGRVTQTYEIISSSKINASEWLYESRDQEKIEAFEEYRQAYNCMQNDEHDKARELLQKYLQINSDDQVAKKHLKMLESNTL